jgi:hypothetical protein
MVCRVPTCPCPLNRNDRLDRLAPALRIRISSRSIFLEEAATLAGSEILFSNTPRWPIAILTRSSSARAGAKANNIGDQAHRTRYLMMVFSSDFEFACGLHRLSRPPVGWLTSELPGADVRRRLTVWYFSAFPVVRIFPSKATSSRHQLCMTSALKKNSASAFLDCTSDKSDA